MPLDFDCIVTVSGDGLIHEVLNGLADRTDSEVAFKIPLAPIPAGSGNGMCVNLLGLEVGETKLLERGYIGNFINQTALDVSQACLNVLKG